jgi:glucan phosphoethanolaminetransferase (alkaline phosphatase superfamily)
VGLKRLPFLPLIGVHLLASAAVEAAFVWKFGHNPRAIAAHVLLLAEWDLAMAALLGSGLKLRLFFAVTCTLQIYLYTLNLISNLSWGRNISGHLVAAFAPTIWSGKEPFPVGALGISTFAVGTLALMVAILVWSGPTRQPSPIGFTRRASAAVVMFGLCYATAIWGIASRDNLLWTYEPVASFFRPDGYAFEPSARRAAAAARDGVLRAAYPHPVPKAHRKNVVLIIVDSLRADRMQVYGYPRATTPFLSQLVQTGCMNKVELAFSTCSESFCGITSTLASREFRDISARTFQLQDVLRDEGYRTWFLLSGNHTSWNGLQFFYRADNGALFDGTQTRRYTMDDDRLVLEGLERVPAASREQPAFFYFHLMSTHFLGVEFDESHVFTRPDDRVSPGLQPFRIANLLNKPDRYDDKVLQADGLIRRIFDALTAKHYLDDAIVVVIGDHGEGLGERHWAHGWDLHDEDIRIPMLIYDAPAAGYPDLSFAAQVDVAPTILDRLGLPVPASWEGQSLLTATQKRFTYHQTYFFPNRYAVIDRDDPGLFKFIATPQYNTEELFDLRVDPGEMRNLVKEKPELAALLRARVHAYLEDKR